jgi:tetratricopeptide (TPR) repeat protein
MKAAFVLLLFITHSSFAQLNLPELSPRAHLTEEVGYTTFHVHYGRPAIRGRKIMGGLVPYKKLWRTGGGKSTTIQFDHPVTIAGKKIAAGIYNIGTIPDEKEWTVMLNSDTSKIYGDPSEYDKATEVISFKVTPKKTERVYESLTVGLDIVKYDAIFYLSWENTQISFPIETRTYKKALTDIAAAVSKSPDDPELLSQAAWFYYMDNENLGQALEWVDRALLKGNDRWRLRQRFDILERMKRYDEAKKAATRAIDFLTSTKPSEWEESVKGYQEKMKLWAKN